MNLQQVFLRLFLLSQISQDTFQQLQTQKHRQTLETSQDLKYTSTFIHHLPNHLLPISPILSAGCRGSPLFFLLPWDRRLTPSYSPRGRPSASGAPGGVWKHSVLTTIPIMLLQERHFWFWKSSFSGSNWHPSELGTGAFPDHKLGQCCQPGETELGHWDSCRVPDRLFTTGDSSFYLKMKGFFFHYVSFARLRYQKTKTSRYFSCPTIKT